MNCLFLFATAPCQGHLGRCGMAGAVQAGQRQHNRPDEPTAIKPDGSWEDSQWSLDGLYCLK